MSLNHVKTLKMTDDVLSVKYSPDGKLLAVSLLDSTVKVFFQDTLKFFLSLYGHKVCTSSSFQSASYFDRLLSFTSSPFSQWTSRSTQS